MSWEDPPEWQCVTSDRIEAQLGALQSHDLLTFHPFAGGAAVQITSAGISKAAQYTRDRTSPIRRLDFAANSLVSAAMDNYPRPRIDIQEFLDSSRTWFYDRALDPAEVGHAVEHLEQSGLARVERTATEHPVALTLTQLGIDCGACTPISVRTFMKDQNAQSSITFNGPVQGAQIGNHNTQTNTQGPDLAQLAEFTRKTLETVRATGLPDAAHGRVVAAGEALQEQLEVTNPEPGLVHRLRDAFLLSITENLGQTATGGAVRVLAASCGIDLP
ncbi:hypothetical protein [Streptomyces sp. NPDC007355]|uniref:hypothetical protein n=1 Tax=Streptomyces sp. NPDC007355 TaxID=3364778 RepID=UPI0036A5C58F